MSHDADFKMRVDPKQNIIIARRRLIEQAADKLTAASARKAKKLRKRINKLAAVGTLEYNENNRRESIARLRGR